MVSDHEHDWGHWGRVGVTRSPMVSDDERNWGHWGRVGARPAVPWCRLSWSPIMSELGALGPGGCHALGPVLSHTVSDQSAIGATWGRVTRFGDCGLPWSPIMSAIGAIGAGWVSLSHGLRSVNWRLGVARFGPVSDGLMASRPPIMSALGLGGCHAVRVRVPPRSPITSKGLRVSRFHGLRAGVGRFGPVVSVTGVGRVWGGWVRGLPRSPVMSTMGLGGCHAVVRSWGRQVSRGPAP